MADVPLSGVGSMTEVIFLVSNQGHQLQRVRSVSERLQQRLPDINVRIVEPRLDELAKYKLKFGPAGLIDGLLEYVGVPRLSLLVDRVLQVREGRPNPRTAAEKAAEKPATPAPSPRPAGAPTPPGGGL